MKSQTITTGTNSKRFNQTVEQKNQSDLNNGDTVQQAKQDKAEQHSNSKPVTPEPDHESSQVARETTFRLDAPGAGEVLLAGEFTEWEKAPVKLIKGGGGIWHTKVALAPGRHLYRFLVDGQWQDDPNRPGREANSFGSTNSFVEVI